MPGRLEFAAAIRHALLREQPEVVAVEFPMSLERVYMQAVARLPEISVILYEGETRRSADLRSGRAGRSVHRSRSDCSEMGAEVVFIEPDLSPEAASG